MTPIQHVGYIGLGIMGSAMAQNLLKGGYKVTVWNRTIIKADALRAVGAAVATSPADLASRRPDVICINVTDTPDVEAILFGDNGLATQASPGLIVVDHSTISPVATQEFAQRLAARHVTLLDAPVSGGDVGARNATLSIMVGGPADAFERILPMLQKVGKTITHLGPAGMGQVCKACNQIAVALTLMGTCEAIALAKKSGLDVEKMLQVVGAGAGASWQISNLGPRIAQGDHNPGFMIDLILKDLAIVGDTSRRLQLPLAGTALAENYFRAVAAGGGGRLGTQAMCRLLEQLGNFKIK